MRGCVLEFDVAGPPRPRAMVVASGGRRVSVDGTQPAAPTVWRSSVRAHRTRGDGLAATRTRHDRSRAPPGVEGAEPPASPNVGHWVSWLLTCKVRSQLAPDM